MANINDFKLLNQKCVAYFNLLEKELGKQITVSDDIEKARLGFYLYLLECICNIKDLSEIVELITDNEFNATVFQSGHNDWGVDAIFFDEEKNCINLFNFKYRKQYSNKGQRLNETILTTKYGNAILNNDSSLFQGKLKTSTDRLLSLLNSNDVWNLKLYVVSNESIELDTSIGEIQQLEQAYELEIIPIGLDKIANFMSTKPKPIDASLIVDNEAVMTYSETELSSAKSFVIKLTVPELIRITSNSKEFREKSNMEDYNALSKTDLDYSILFDNVRGFLGETKYNINIYLTLKTEPTKFFMYNNGLTITAKNIEAEPINVHRKLKIKFEDFQVVNGGQTLRTIHKFNSQDSDNLKNFLAQSEILVRVFKTGNSADLTNKIAEYTNSQNAISIIDLKSLAYEQIQIEQFLDENNIIYARKIGDTGISKSRNYEHKITMEKFAQILYSLKGFPEKASNQKKAIFEKHYDSIFGEENFKLEDSAEIIKRYYSIKTSYENNTNDYQSSDQKIFFILYLDQFFDSKADVEIEFFEKILIEFKKDEELAPARKLIQTQFKQVLDNKLKKLGKIVE